MNKFYLILLSSVSYCLPFHSNHLWPFTFLSLFLLFLLQKNNSYRESLLTGFTWGAITSGFLSWWLIKTLIYQYEQTIAIALIIQFFAVILPWGILFAAFSATVRFFYKNSILFVSLTLPALWVIFNYLKEILPIYIPWGLASYSLSELKNFIQIIDITGIYGLDFIIASISSTSVFFLKILTNKTSENCNKTALLGLSTFILLLLITTPLFYGTSKIKEIQKQVESPLSKRNHCRIIQGNFDPKYRWLSNGFRTRFYTYLKLTNKDSRQPTINIWPETVLNSNTIIRKNLYRSIYTVLAKNDSLLSGGTRRQCQEVFNSAFFFSKDKTIQHYDKQILLPLAESSISGFGLGKFYTAPTSFNQGKTFQIIKTDFGTTGVSICLEILYPDYIRKSVVNDSTFLINIANDSWFGDTSEPEIHFKAAIFRAIENRRYLLRGSNTGISGIISADGTVVKKSNLFSREIIEGTFLLLSEKSFYTKYGNYIILVFILIILLQLIIIAVKE